jgi:hypothetical protein
MPKKRVPAKTPTRKRRTRTPSRSFWISIATLAGVGIIGVLAYSVMMFQSSSYEKQGFITCNAENTVCEESKHIHADVHVTLCSNVINFPKEKGDTGKQHTHKERNKIHWHARINVDPVAQSYIDASPRRLSAFFEQMETPIPTTCNGKPAAVQVLANGQAQTMDYVWSDGDLIHVIVE